MTYQQHGRTRSRHGVITYGCQVNNDLCNPFFQQWAEGLRAKCKSKISVIGAAMRKLVHSAYGVLKTGRPFDPKWAQGA